MVSSEQKLANVVGGKTARACDNCIRKRARWYCAADDAFLCQSCDASVHSANPLARRHERVRLKVASLKLSSLDNSAPPPWHRGFTKKPRTPRGGNQHQHKHASREPPKSEESSMSFNPLHLVPEIGSDEATTTVTCEDQLLYQVPVFDPFAAELCVSPSNEVVKQITTHVEDADQHHHDHLGSKVMVDLNSMNGLILPSDMELAEFAADVESLLGKGLDEESSFAMEGLGLLDCRENDMSMERSVKVEEDQLEYDHNNNNNMLIDESEMEMMREPFQLSFDYDGSPLWQDQDDDEKILGAGDYMHLKEDHVDIQKYDYDDDDEINNKNKKKILKLDYEGVIAAWDAEQKSPWTSGDRPDLDPDDCWLQCMGGIMHQHQQHPYGDMGMMTGNPAMLDGGREARVSRYREKRRTRLFSKKIRYEVRKLNAEKRPRMKGRFVKRTSTSGFPLLTI